MLLDKLDRISETLAMLRGEVETLYDKVTQTHYKSADEYIRIEHGAIPIHNLPLPP